MINEAKERELYDAARTPKCHEAWLAWLARARVAAEDAEKWLIALTKAAADLDEAREDVEGWAAYAGEYFREKHDLAGDLARIKQCAEDARKALPPPAAAQEGGEV